VSFQDVSPGSTVSFIDPLRGCPVRLSSLTYAKSSSRLKQVPRDYRMLRSGKILPGLWLLYFAKRSKDHGLLKEVYRMLPELAPE